MSEIEFVVTVGADIIDVVCDIIILST